MRYGYSIDAGQFTSPSGKETTVTLVTVRHVREKIVGGSLIRGEFDNKGGFRPVDGAEPIDKALLESLCRLENWLSYMNSEWFGYDPEYPDPMGLRQKAAEGNRLEVVALSWRDLGAYLAVHHYVPTATSDRRLSKELNRRWEALSRGEEVYTPPKVMIVSEGDLLPL